MFDYFSYLGITEFYIAVNCKCIDFNTVNLLKHILYMSMLDLLKCILNL